MRQTPTILAALLAATAAGAQSAGTEADIAFAETVWDEMMERALAGSDMILAAPYAGSQPHGAMLETFYAVAEIDGEEGLLVVKRNYGPEGVSADDILDDPGAHLNSITVMFQREGGYDPQNGNWFYAKYLPDGTLDETADGMALAGAVGREGDGCIACHRGAPGGDYLFTTDAY